jgi:hypothetical protein
MVFCSIDVGVGGKVPFVVICHRGSAETRMSRRDEGHELSSKWQGSVREIRPFVLFVIRNLCVWQRMSGSEWW